MSMFQGVLGATYLQPCDRASAEWRHVQPRDRRLAAAGRHPGRRRPPLPPLRQLLPLLQLRPAQAELRAAQAELWPAPVLATKVLASLPGIAQIAQDTQANSPKAKTAQDSQANAPETAQN